MISILAVALACGGQGSDGAITDPGNGEGGGSGGGNGAGGGAPSLTIHAASALIDSVLTPGLSTKLEIVSTSGAAVAGSPVWSSDDSTIVSVAADGWVTGRRDGTTSVRATLNGQTIAQRFTVNAAAPNLPQMHLHLADCFYYWGDPDEPGNECSAELQNSKTTAILEAGQNGTMTSWAATVVIDNLPAVASGTSHLVLTSLLAPSVTPVDYSVSLGTPVVKDNGQNTFEIYFPVTEGRCVHIGEFHTPQPGGNPWTITYDGGVDENNTFIRLQLRDAFTVVAFTQTMFGSGIDASGCAF